MTCERLSNNIIDEGEPSPKGPRPNYEAQYSPLGGGNQGPARNPLGPSRRRESVYKALHGCSPKGKMEIKHFHLGGGIPLTLGSRPKDNMEIKHFHLGEGFPRPRNVDGKSQSTKYEPRGPINKFSSVSPFQGNGGGVYHLYFVPLSLLLIVCAPHTRAPTHRNPHPSHTWTNCPRVTVTPRRMFLGPRRGPVSSHRP